MSNVTLMFEDDQWYRFDSEDQDFGTPVTLPMKYEVCHRCHGAGVHDHPAFSNGLTHEDFDADPDFREDYLSGAFDVRCETCGGQRVVRVVNADALPESLREAFAAWQADREASAREEAYYARMRERGIQF